MKRSIHVEMCVQWVQSRAYLEIILVIQRKYESVRASVQDCIEPYLFFT